MIEEHPLNPLDARSPLYTDPTYVSWRRPADWLLEEHHGAPLGSAGMLLITTLVLALSAALAVAVVSHL